MHIDFFNVAVSPVSLLLALLLDQVLGEPPQRWHPVVWMGTAIGMARRWAPQRGKWGPLAYGALLMLGGTAGVIGVGLFLQQLLLPLPAPLRWLLEAGVLKTTFSLRGLAKAAGEVRQALATANVTEARRLLSWHLVSRDTRQLNVSQVAAATVESVAENASDGVVAPLFYYALGGLPAALAYRFVNTADSMLGYRDPIHLWLGNVPARLDDLVNLLPARLTALCIVLAAPLLGHQIRQAWRIWWQDARRTASPNAGHPMSSMAGALQVELVKLGHYRLGMGQTQPVASDIARAVRLLYGATALAVALLLLLMVIPFAS